MIPWRFLCVLSVVLSGLASVPARGEVRLHGLFSDNMVLQSGTASVWGWAEGEKDVMVEIQDRRARAKVRGGAWKARLRRLKPGGPFELKVTSGDQTTLLTNVMVGEVWVASGQSNMQWPLSRSHNVTTEIASANNYNLRLFTVPRLKADEPLDDVNASWLKCEPGSVSEFSAVAYYFGRDLQKALGVPVGVIHTSWGGSPAEVWMSAEALSSNRTYREEILDPFPVALTRFQARLAEHQAEKTKAKEAGIAFTKRPPRRPWKPSELYNGMIAPLIPFEFKGAIWYQGESNAQRAYQYRSLFPDMIRNWRRDWGVGKFPFLHVQLAPFRKIQPEPGESDWAELREAQLLATQTLSDVGMAVITDVGEEDNIHPSKKEPVGGRLALAARDIAYGEKITGSGPIFKKMKIRGGKAYLTFDYVGLGLEARGGELTGFTIAGADRTFVRAQASLEGERVVVSSPLVPEPVAVRYGWADYPVVNLWNKDGLPASPFRTDRFPMITEPKKDTGASAAILKKEFIYNEASFPSCHASTIADTPSGVVAAWFGGTDEGDDDVGIWVSRHISGKWTSPFEVVNGVQEDGDRHPCWNPVLFQAPGGALILFYKVGPSPSKWWGMQIESTDGGVTWGTARRLPEGILGPVKDKAVLMPNGDLLCPSSSEHDGWRIHLERTTDLGKTWTRTEALNDGKEFGAIQPTLIPWSENSIQMLCRTRGGKRISEIWSSDGGKTWGEMQLTSLPNPNAGIDAVLLQSGEALLVYNHTTRGRTPLSVAISVDGRNFQAAAVLENEKGEYSYPAVIQSSDGLVHVTYTWKRERIRHVVIDPTKLKPRPIVDGVWPTKPLN